MISLHYDPIEYWERRGQTGTNDVTELGLPGFSMLRTIYSKVRLDDSFLEVGSGRGRIFLFLEQDGVVNRTNYTMCDIARSSIAHCREATGIKPEWWDGKTLPYDDGSFDWVLSYSVLLHVPPADIERHVEEMARVTSKWVFISTYDGPDKKFAPHCFKHDYLSLFAAAGLQEVSHNWHEDKRQAQWLLRI